MKQPELIVNFEVFENATNFVGLANVDLPNIQNLLQSINGAGISGNVNGVAIGNTEAMTATFHFRSGTGSVLDLMKPVKHTIDMRAAEQSWDTVGTGRDIAADKYVMVIVPTNYQPGNVAPSAPPDVGMEVSVHYYAGFKDGKKLWEIDPYNYIYEIDGVDYMADVRRAVGK